VKKSSQYQYLQIVQNRREGTKTIQRVVATIGRICVVSDRGMISSETMAYLEAEKIPYILGVRMRLNNEVKG
jgi:hypothetical protein